MLDIAKHLISRAGFRQPESYNDIKSVLEENGIISAEFAGRIEKLPDFRNLLIHEYLLIDRTIVYEKIQQSLPDLEEFLSHLLSYLNR
ncbi:DUF86 domain-containing protein [candidate division KSB1 bacterium]|nr:DUF86 domain-containing protein [candidate division KSB1 bacterium]